MSLSGVVLLLLFGLSFIIHYLETLELTSATIGRLAQCSTDIMGIKVIVNNRKAYHNYTVSDKYEAGISLCGTEVKSVRGGKVSLKEAWVDIDNNQEAWLQDCHIAKYSHGNVMNHEEVHPRRLLLHRKELKKLSEKKSEKGFSVVPLKIYLKGQLVKVEIGIAKGKKLHDKRESQKSRDADREMARAMRRKG